MKEHTSDCVGPAFFIVDCGVRKYGYSTTGKNARSWLLKGEDVDAKLCEEHKRSAVCFGYRALLTPPPPLEISRN